MAKGFYADRIAPGSHRAKTPEGFLVCVGIPIARTGWYEYRASELGLAGEQIIKVHRSPEEVFAPETLASFEGKSITSNHPPVFLTPENDSGYNRGHVQNLRRGGRLSDGTEALLADLVIKDVQLIGDVENHDKEEISAGYNCEYVPVDGGYAQQKIRGNHVAVVSSGRAGNEVRILDSQEDAVDATATPTVEQMEKQLGFWEGVFKKFGWKAPTMDAESEAVKINEKYNARALERAEMRNRDDDKKVRHYDDDDDKRHARDDDDDRHRSRDDDKKMKDDDKKAKDAEEEKEERMEERKEMKKATDAMNRLCDTIGRFFDKKAKDDDEEEEEKEHKKKEESEDSELIPVPTMGKEDRPKNPIPGADSLSLDALKILKPLVAKTGTNDQKQAWNRCYRAMKDGDIETAQDAYGQLLKTKKPDGVEFASTDRAAKAEKNAQDFAETARQYHRKNAQEVVIKRGA